MKIGKIIRKIAIILSLVMLITSTVGTTYCYLFTKTDSLVGVFVPELLGEGALSVNKKVEHPLGEDYAIPDNIEFEFSIELGNYYAHTKLNTTIGELTADAEGTLVVSVKPDTVFAIYDLEEGTVAKVTEMPTELNGFAVKGEATKTLTVGADGTANFDFVNVYTPNGVKPINITISGSKILEGRDWQTGDNFTFVLEQQLGMGWKVLGEQMILFDEDDDHFNKFNFNDVFHTLIFDKVGIYNFRVTEKLGSLAGIDYDKTVNNFIVKVTDVDMDGHLEINIVSGTENIVVTKIGDDYAIHVTFNSSFVPPPVTDPDPVDVQIRINKILKNVGKAIHARGGFKFVLKNVETSEALRTISDDAGEADFELTFTKADIGKTYTYELSETNEGLVGMTYDKDVHEITVAISLDDNNELVTAFTMDGKSVDALSATFENIYDADIPDAPPTNDDANIMMWFILMLISASALIALLIYDKKHYKD